MRKNEDKKVIADGAKLQLPYYNNYPDDEPIIKVLSEEDEQRERRRKAAVITLPIVAGALVILAIVSFFLLKSFVFFPNFSDAFENTLESMIPDTAFDFAKLEKEGQTSLEYNYDGMSISYWETHKGSASSSRMTVKDNGDEDSYRYVSTNKEFAVMYGNAWYGAKVKDAEAALAAVPISPAGNATSKLTEAEGAYLLTFLEYLGKVSSDDVNTKIATNFVDGVFKTSYEENVEVFRGTYAILDSDRYVKSRAYTIDNENLVSFINDLISELQVADPTVKEAFVKSVMAHITEGEMTFDGMIDELNGYIDEIKNNDPFKINLEICYSGKKLSAILITKNVTVSEEKTDYNQIIVDFFNNGIKIREESKTLDAEKNPADETYTEVNFALAPTANGFSLKVTSDTDGKAAQIKLTLNGVDGKFDLTASFEDTDTFTASGTYLDSKEQFDLKFTNVMRNGVSDNDFKFAVTFYYKTVDVEMPAYKDIFTMSSADLDAMRKNTFDWEFELPEKDELRVDVEKFFGLDKAIAEDKKNNPPATDSEASKK